MPVKNEGLFRLAGYAAGFALLFAIWHIAAVYVVGSILFPPPASVIVRAIELIRDAS
jgi:ABC-type nitrate/sulfonate/bicarbonate transport system permease component